MFEYSLISVLHFICCKIGLISIFLLTDFNYIGCNLYFNFYVYNGKKFHN